MSSLPVSCAARTRPVVSDDALKLIARRFALLSEPLRLRLVQLLFEGEQNVHTLVERSAGTPPNVSRHLQALASAGLLARRKAGLEVYYSVADESLRQLCEIACGSLEQQLARQANALHAGVAEKVDEPAGPAVLSLGD